MNGGGASMAQGLSPAVRPYVPRSQERVLAVLCGLARVALIIVVVAVPVMVLAGLLGNIAGAVIILSVALSSLGFATFRYSLWKYRPFVLLAAGCVVISSVQTLPTMSLGFLIFTNIGKLGIGLSVVAFLAAGRREHPEQSRGVRPWNETLIIVLASAAWFVQAMSRAWAKEPDTTQRFWIFGVTPLISGVILVPALILLSRLRMCRGPVPVVAGLAALGAALVSGAATGGIGTADLPAPALVFIWVTIGLICWGMLEPTITTLADGTAEWVIDRAWQRSLMLILIPAGVVGFGALHATGWIQVSWPLLLMVSIVLLGVRTKLLDDGLLARQNPPRPGKRPGRRPLTFAEMQLWCRSVQPTDGKPVICTAVVVQATTELSADRSNSDRWDDVVNVEVARRLTDVVWVADDSGERGARGRWEVAQDGGRFLMVAAHYPAAGSDRRSVADQAAARLTKMYDHWLALPFDLGGTAVRLTFTIGFSVAQLQPGDAAWPVTQDALWAAQTAELGHPRRFRLADRQAAVRRAELGALLEQTVAAGPELTLVFEPIVDLATGRAVAAEALARWNPPGRGPVSPGEFIPLAEQTGAILPLGQRVLTDACAAARTAPPDRAVAINVSGVELAQGNLYQRIMQALTAAGVPPQQLILEITETTVNDIVDAARDQLWSLAAAGVRLSMDDFGTAASGLARLLVLPWSYVKLDRSLLRGLRAIDSSRAALIRAISHLCLDLGAATIAEGVETGEALELVTALGCQYAQGWIFGKGRPQLSDAWILGQIPPPRTPADPADTPRPTSLTDP